MANPQIDFGGSSLSCNDIIMGVPSPIGSTQVTGYGSLAFSKLRTSGVNFNAGSTDTTVTLNLPVGTTRYIVQSIWLSNASASLSTATVGVFTGAGATGQTLAATQAITVTTASANTIHNAQSLTLTNQATECYTATTLYINVANAQGSAATGDVTLVIQYI
jgi:hypothetical protein